jgi:hypothetical protein
MTLLGALKLASTAIVICVVALAIVNPAFNFGIFIGGVTLGGYLFQLLEEF